MNFSADDLIAALEDDLENRVFTDEADEEGEPLDSHQGFTDVDTLIVPDTDTDGVADHNDNCTLVGNADQRDTDEDGFGNI